jgi:hypothetical protein
MYADVSHKKGQLYVSAEYQDSLLRAHPKLSLDMALKVSRNKVGDEATQEFLKWVQDLKRVRDDFEALMDEYEGKRQRLLESIQEEAL